MQFNNLKIILVFITFALLVLSSPVHLETRKSKDVANSNKKSLENPRNKDLEASSSEDDVTLYDSDSEVEVIPRDDKKVIVEDSKDGIKDIKLTDKILSINEKFGFVEIHGDFGLDAFLKQGGSADGNEVVKFFLNYLGYDSSKYAVNTTQPIACSTIFAPNKEGKGYLFGRDYDYYNCSSLAVVSHPKVGYSSISTADIDFIKTVGGVDVPEDVLSVISNYTPLDGINEKGLSISINAVVSTEKNVKTIQQNDPKKGNLTTALAVRVMLDKAATVDEAIAILNQYNLHASMDLLIHFHIADANGKSVAVEYLNNEMHITETPILTNYYVINGFEQPQSKSKDPRDIVLMKTLNEKQKMNVAEVKDALKTVSQNDTVHGIYTQWAVIYDQSKLEATYYHLLDFEHGYRVKLEN